MKAVQVPAKDYTVQTTQRLDGTLQISTTSYLLSLGS